MKSRRNLKILNVVGIAVVLGAYAIFLFFVSSGTVPTYGGITFESDNVREGEYRPVIGGVAVTSTDTGTGTLGAILENSTGQYAVTSRHVIDSTYCEDVVDSETVKGEPAYQPAVNDSWCIGTVADHSDDSGAGASDWALINTTDNIPVNNTILGVSNVGSNVTPSVGDRIVMSGMNTGMLGGVVTNTDVKANLQGCLVDDLIAYQVDDNADTSGNSGSLVGVIDGNNQFRPVGFHSFQVNDTRYAIPLSDVTDSTNATLATGDNITGSDLETDVAQQVEATAVSYNSSANTTDVLVANVGGSPIDVTIQTRETGSLNIMDETNVSVPPVDSKTVTLNTTSDRFELDYERNRVTVEFSA